MSRRRGHLPEHPEAVKKAASRELRAAVLRFASTWFFWESDGKGGGPYLQNFTDNPLPVRKRLRSKFGDGSYLKRMPATLSSRKFHNHLFVASRPLFVTNNPAADVWHLALDIDDDADAGLSARMNAQVLKARGFVSASRGTGQHVHFKLDTAGVDAGEAVAQLRVIAESLRAKYPKTGAAQFETIKGIPVIIRANEAFDFDLAQSRVEVCTEHYHEPWMIEKKFEWQAYERHAATYTDRFERIDELEPATVHFDRDNSLLVPCVHRPGRTIRQAAEQLERYLTWSRSAETVTLDQLEGFCGVIRLPDARPVQPAPVAAAAPSPARRRERDERLEAILRHREDDDVFDCSSKTSRMIRSDKKYVSRLGAVFAVLQEHGDLGQARVAELAHPIYSEHGAASDSEFDTKRRSDLGQAYRFAVRGFDDDKRGVGDIALAALDRQTGGAKRVTVEKIRKLRCKLDRIIPVHRLRHTSTKGVAVGLLTLDLNRHRHDTGDVPERVQRYNERATWLRLHVPDDGSFANPTATLRGNDRKKDSRGMLGHFNMRRNGSAVREINEVVEDLDGGVCTDRRFSSGTFDEHGRKIGEGYCRRWKAGAALTELLKGIHDDAGADSAMSDTQYRMWSGKIHTLVPNTSLLSLSSPITARRHASSSRSERSPGKTAN